VKKKGRKGNRIPGWKINSKMSDPLRKIAYSKRPQADIPNKIEKIKKIFL
jgi:hypothetical protein